MTNVIKLRPSTDIPDSLRAIADQIESGEVVADNMTLCLAGNSVEVWHIGNTSDEDVGMQAVFNMTMGLSKVTVAVNDVLSKE